MKHRPSRQELRVAAVWRLLRRGAITKDQAKALAVKPSRGIAFQNIDRTIEQWKTPCFAFGTDLSAAQ